MMNNDVQHVYKAFSEYQSVGNIYSPVTVENFKDINLDWLSVFIMLYIISYMHSQVRMTSRTFLLPFKFD